MRERVIVSVFERAETGWRIPSDRKERERERERGRKSQCVIKRSFFI